MNKDLLDERWSLIIKLSSEILNIIPNKVDIHSTGEALLTVLLTNCFIHSSGNNKKHKPTKSKGGVFDGNNVQRYE